MGFGDIFAVMTLDSTKWESTIRSVDAKASNFADKVEHKLSKKISKYFGVGLVTGVVADNLLSPLHKVMDALFEGPGERAKQIDDESKALGVSAEQYQAIELAAKGAHLSVGKWIEEVKSHKIPLADAIAKLEQYRSQVSLTNTDVKRLLSSGMTGNLVKSALDLNNKAGRQFEEDQAVIMLLEGQGHGLLWRLTHPSEVSNARSLVKQSFSKMDSSANNPKDLIQALGSGSFKPDFAVNEWQRIGDFVGGDSAAKTAEIAINTAQTAESSKVTQMVVTDIKQILTSIGLKVPGSFN